jgi:hypothetical protein
VANTRNQVLAALALAACGVAVVGCANQGPEPYPAATGSVQAAVSGHLGSSMVLTPSAGNPSTGSGTGRTITAGDPDNGHTITLAVGDSLEVRLSGAGWTFSADTSGPALRQVGQPTAGPAPTGGTSPTAGRSACVPGGNCIQVTATFAAASPGQAVVLATRTSCGEAMRCTGGAGSYRLSVVVDKAP